MYIIDDYQLIKADDALYLGNYGIGAKIANKKLAYILESLQKKEKLELSEAELSALATQHAVDIEQLKTVLMNQLNILQPRPARKFPMLYINSDDTLITEFLQESLSKEYTVQCVETSFGKYSKNSLVLFYRNNYSHEDYQTLFKSMPEDVYFITAGIIHKILIIDNLYYKGSGLPTHFSNLNNLLACVHNDIAITKNNWLLFYRKIMKDSIDKFPDPTMSKCQRGYIAYSLLKFTSQFTNFWKLPTTLDEINWFWNVDLTSFSVNKEVAIHSPYSEYDMNLNFSNIAREAPIASEAVEMD